MTNSIRPINRYIPDNAWVEVRDNQPALVFAKDRKHLGFLLSLGRHLRKAIPRVGKIKGGTKFHSTLKECIKRIAPFHYIVRNWTKMVQENQDYLWLIPEKVLRDGEEVIYWNSSIIDEFLFIDFRKLWNRKLSLDALAAIACIGAAFDEEWEDEEGMWQYQHYDRYLRSNNDARATLAQPALFVRHFLRLCHDEG